ncbi:MAG: flippase-like domain-containing protein [Acidobacteriia bacterium]|nr:flippase-like domain-containing protein [Terriglobia bacterium]
MAGCVLAAAAVVWFLEAQLAARGFDWKLAADSFVRLRWRWLALSVVPIAGTYAVRALRWAVFLKPLKARPSLRNLLSATVIGFTAITLFGRAGDFVRPYLISVKEKVPVTSQLATWVLERVFDLLMASLLLAFALARVQAWGAELGPKLAWVLAFGGRFVGFSCLAVLLLLVSMRHFAEPVRHRLVAAMRFLPEAQFLRIEKLITAAVQGVESTRSDGALLLVLLYSVLEWALIAACYWCLARSFVESMDLAFVNILILMGFVSFGGIVQIPGVGGGTQVAAVLVLTELFGVRLELATSFALLMWILSFVVIVPVGLALAVKEGLDWQSLRRISRGASQ